ncbi:MAG: PQQ-binding-like beta-propeller repeat protein [Kiritimatiellia bacterium]|nr:PQQ-binding-like beta-propeller repeat protein [Kiritimatiellia bacterium]MDP6848066.1 PQQ-binding-like beta-propeller repeat protein [Kiritimatiellia bacterium]
MPWKSRSSLALFAILSLFLPCHCDAKEGFHAEGLAVSKEPGWPQWRGARRDGICDEKGLLQSWPEGGPKRLWVMEGLGKGFSSPVISDSAIYITGDVGDRLVIFCLDFDGLVKWKIENGRSWKRSYQGARACCLIHRGRIYNMNGHGRVVCLDAKDGSEEWAVNVLERFGGKEITWGHSECLLIDGDRLVVTPGGSRAMMATLALDTGKTVWTSAPIPGDSSSYSSPILFSHGGMRHLVNCSSTHAFGVNADTGKLLWYVDRPTRYKAITSTPTYLGKGRVFVASPDQRESELLQIEVSGDRAGVSSLWQCRMNNLIGGTIHLEGLLYGSGYKKNYGWYCIDGAAGETRFHYQELYTGSAIYADGRFYCFSDKGMMALLEPTADGFKTHGSFRLVGGDGKKVSDAWAHPVICNGRLYLRYHDKLYCYNVK